MLMQEVDAATFCPGLDDERVRHLPRTEDFRPRTLSYIDSSVKPSQERLVFVTECRRLANPPADSSTGLYEPCAECVAARHGINIPGGYTLAPAPAVETRPTLSVISA